MATTKEFEQKRAAELDKRSVALKETQQLIDDTMSDVKWKEGKGRKGRAYFVYDDPVYDKKTETTKLVKTIGNGINIDAKHGGAHNIKFLKDLVGEDAFSDMLSGARPIDLDINKRAVKYNIELGIKYARNAIKDFDSRPYDVRRVAVDMFYNVGGNLPRRMPSFIDALDRGNYYEASMELKHKNPYGKKGKAVDMDTTNYFDQTTGRGKLNFEALNLYREEKPKTKELSEGVVLSEGKKMGEIIFNFPDNFGQ